MKMCAWMKAVLVMGVLALGATGCVVAPFEPPSGIIAHTTAPLSTEGNFAAGSKCGEASSTSVLGLYASGDCSIATAIRNGRLKKVDHIDYAYTNIIGIWQKATVIVYGE